MKRWWGALCLLAVSSLVSSQTADEIVSKAIAARGGMEKIKAVKVLRMGGHISFGPGQEGSIVVTWERPGKFRQELNMGGKTILRVTDGAAAWSINPFGDSGEPQLLSGDEMKLIDEQADFDKPLVDYKKKGNQVELVGKEDVDGHPAYKLKITLKDGAVRYLSIDATSFLDVKWQGKVKIDGKEPEFTTYFHDYRAVEGVKYPFVIDTLAGTPDAPAKQTITFEKVDVNVPADDTLFAKPAAAK